jgi:hypothetical protein
MPEHVSMPTRTTPAGLASLGRVLTWESFRKPQLTSLIEALMSMMTETQKHCGRDQNAVFWNTNIKEMER